ncbi:Rft protein-domain-containing protein [Lactarius sanguifluus]|nr:Rft protein-domain-containing protein [Lactarius sanguifluus]
MTAPSVVKHFLTEGDKLLISHLNLLADQGSYATASNYGSLAVRVVFQPIEETSRIFFSKSLSSSPSSSSSENDQEALQTAVELLSTLLLFTHFLLYLPAMAYNGVLEAFLASVCTPADLRSQSRMMGTGSGRGCGSGDDLSERRSIESRRSWDPARVERDKDDLLRRASSRVDVGALSGQRASSSMLLRVRGPPARERAVDPEDGSPAAARPATSPTCRLYTPGSQRESTPASAKPDLSHDPHRECAQAPSADHPHPSDPLLTLPSESRAAAGQQTQTDKSTSTAR